jgi:aryl-alcohol dehydrogenase-like predicted oxidoreductase
VSEGKIRTYGWSTDLPDRLEFFSQGPNCTAVQVQLNVLDTNWPIVALCEKYDLAALNRGPLAMGLLTDKYTAETRIPVDDVRGVKSQPWMKYFKNGMPNPEWLSRRDAVREVLSSNGRSVAQGALAWLWAYSPQNLPIPGFRTVAQAQENAAAMQFGPLTSGQMQEIDHLLER